MDARAALRSSATGCGRGRSGWVGPFREWCSVLVVVIAVGGVLVAVVHVVDVILVLHGLMAALGAVLVLGDGVMGVVNVGGAHADSFRWDDAASGEATGSRKCASASEMTWETCRSAT